MTGSAPTAELKADHDHVLLLPVTAPLEVTPGPPPTSRRTSPPPPSLFTLAFPVAGLRLART